MAEQSLFTGCNRQHDPANMTDLERKHIPVLGAPDSVMKGQRFDVTVEVGQGMRHPNQYGHFIEFIDLYADDTYLARASLSAVTTCPKVTFCVTLCRAASELRAYARCNLHGLWMGHRPLSVSV